MSEPGGLVDMRFPAKGPLPQPFARENEVFI